VGFAGIKIIASGGVQQHDRLKNAWQQSED
jgi:hypothetical protein